MPKMTKAQHAKHTALLTARNATSNAVFAAAYPRTDVKFCNCLTMASPDVAAAYHEAHKALGEYEWQLIQDNRGYRNAYGHFLSYSR